MAISRYRNVNTIDEEGIPRHYETSDFPPKIVLEKIPTFKLRVSSFDRLDQLAYKHLGDGTYWWVIALINDLDWPYSFSGGDILRIPVNVDDVLRLL